MMHGDQPTSNILIVEDNPGDQRLIQEALRETQLDHTSAVARDGVEALDYLFRRGQFATAPRPDLILLDLNLPKKNGRDVLAAIKADAHLLRIPVVVFSSSSAPQDVASAYQLHANCYVTKPADLDELFSAIGWIAKFWLGTAVLPVSIDVDTDALSSIGGRDVSQTI
jgi:chemotaxis family two-component system response regulator Rcp1